MGRICFLLTILLALYTPAHTQEKSSRVWGTVKDSSGNAVASATVSLIRLKDNAGLYFTQADSKGQFHFDIPYDTNTDSIAIKVNSIGYKKMIQKIKDIHTPANLVLQAEVAALPDVVVNSRQQMIVQKGDTLSYSADRFARKSDRYLGDIIKNLPGIQVDDNGVIKYNGKPINNFYIEGDNLLDDRYNIATDNIPSADIDKIQVIEHNQHVKMLNGIVPSDKAGINITLKNKSKLRLINNADLAAGTPGKWNGTVNNMSFKDHFKAINEIKSNNTGISYSRETGISGLGGPSDLERAQYLYNKAVMTNVNDLYKFNKYTGLRVNAYYVHDIQRTENQSSVTYFLPGNDTVSYVEKNNNHLAINNFNAQLNLNINSDRNFLNNTFSFNQNDWLNQTNTIANAQDILQKADNKTTAFSNALDGYFLIKKKHILNYTSDIQYTNDPQVLRLTPGAQQDVLNDSLPYQNTFQHRRTPTFYTNNKIAYSRIWGAWVLGTEAGFNFQSQQLQSNITLLQNDGAYTLPGGFANALHWQKSVAYFSPQLIYNGYRSRLTISTPFNFTAIRYHNDSILENADKINRGFWLPGINWQYKVGKENNLYASYNHSAQTANINQVYEGGILSGYRSIASFQTPLLLGNAHTFNTGFVFKKIIKVFIANVDLSYSKNRNYFMYASEIQNNLTTIVALPVANNSSSTAVSANVSKYIFALNTTLALNATLSQAKSVQMQNDLLFNTKNEGMNYGLSIKPTVFNWLDMDISSSYSQNTIRSEAAGFQPQMAGQWREKSSVIFYPSEHLSINITNRYFQSFTKKQNLSSYLFMDSYIQYKMPKPKLLLKLSCTNMADIRNYKVVNMDANMVSLASYLLQPRMFLLSAAFDF